MAFSFRKSRITCFSTADWDTPLPTNKHQLMRRLAERGARVLYLETLGTRAPRLGSSTDLSRIWRRLQRAREGPKKREPRLWTLSPLVRPKWRTSIHIALNRFLFRRQMGRLLPRFRGSIAWVYSPFAVHLLNTLKPSLVVYHLVDDLSAVPGADSEALREAELLLFARADLVFCTEQSLYDRARRYARRAYYMPNVADYHHFHQPREVRHSVATRLASMRALPRPRMVFSGNLAPHKVDLDLLDELARRRPGWQFVLIGPVWEGSNAADAPKALRRLKKRENVQLTGRIPYEDLPAFLHEANALMIPYVQNDATRAVFPLKFFEYLATGKPVISSPLPSLYPFQGVARLVDGAEEWEEALETSLDESPERERQRCALARRYTWERRLAEMERAIGELQTKR